MPIKLSDEFVKISTLAAGVGLSSILSLFFLAYTSRTLGPSEAANLFTCVFIIFSLVTLSSPVSTACVRFSSIAYAEDSPHKVPILLRWLKQRLFFTYALMLSIGLPIFLFISPPIPSAFLGSLFITITVSFFVSIVGIERAAVRGSQRYSLQAKNQILEALSRLLIGVVLLEVFVSVNSALTSYLIASIISLALIQNKHIKNKNPNKPIMATDEKHSLYLFMLPILAISIANMGYQDATTPITRLFFSADVTSYFAAASSIARIIYAFSLPLTLFILPYLTYRKHSGGKTSTSVLRMLFIFLSICTPFLGILYLWPETVISFIYGHEFIEASNMLFLLGLAAFLNALTFIIINMLIALNKKSIMGQYAASYIIELAAIFIFNESPIELIYAMLATRGGFLLFVIMFSIKKAPYPPS